MKFLLAVVFTIALIVGVGIMGYKVERNAPLRQFKLSSGETVFCRKVYYGTVSMNLEFCKDGNTYLSQVNVAEVPNVKGE